MFKSIITKYKRVFLVLFSNLDKVFFKSNNTALVISVTSCSRSTRNGISSFIKTSCQFIHSFFASNTERNMRITCAVWMLSLFNKFRTCHNLKTSSVLKSYEVRSKICCWIMVTVIGFFIQEGNEKIFCFLQVFYIQCNVLNFHNNYIIS